MIGFAREFTARRGLPLGIAIMVGTLTSSGTAAHAEAPSRASRQLHLLSIHPPVGVEVAVDGDPPVSISAGANLPFDNRHAHHLDFSCVHDLCEPSKITIGAGSGDQDVDIALKIRPAHVQIEGNLDHRFMIQEDPTLGSACAGVDLTVPLETGQRVVHVIDLQTSRIIAVMLTAGRRTLVSFY
jgi:hypothetical protein